MVGHASADLARHCSMASHTPWCFACLSVSRSLQALCLSHILCPVIASIDNLTVALLYQSQFITAGSDARCTLQADHAELQKQNTALSGTVTALNEEVESLKASLCTAEQQVSDFQQQLAAHGETHQATLEALEKQAETLQVSCKSAVAHGPYSMQKAIECTCMHMLLTLCFGHAALAIQCRL